MHFPRITTYVTEIY